MFRNKGFTLVEILVSLALLGIIAIFIFPVFNHIFNSIFSAGDKTITTYGVQKQLVDIVESNVNGDKKTLFLEFNNGTTTSYNRELVIATSNYKLPNTKVNEKELIIYYYKYTTP